MKCLMELEKVPISWNEKLAYLTYKFLDEEQTSCPVTHIFKEGWYIREIFIPKETLFIGRPHRRGHRCELVSGKVLHITEDEKRYIQAPFSMTTTPGYQMVVYAMEDVIGRTYHTDNGERNIDVLELEIFHPLDEMKLLGATVQRRLE